MACKWTQEQIIEMTQKKNKSEDSGGFGSGTDSGMDAATETETLACI